MMLEGEREGSKGGRKTKGHKSVISMATLGWKKFESLFPFLFSVFLKFSTLHIDDIFEENKTNF